MPRALAAGMLGGLLALLPTAGATAQWIDNDAVPPEVRDEYWEDRFGPDTFDEGLEEDLYEELQAERAEEAWDELDAPSMYYDTTEEDGEFLGNDYGYPYGPYHPHSPVFAEENPGIGGMPWRWRWYSDDWFVDEPGFDGWYDDLEDEVYDYHERDYLDADGDVDTGYEDFEYDDEEFGDEEFGDEEVLDDVFLDGLRDNDLDGLDDLDRDAVDNDIWDHVDRY